MSEEKTRVEFDAPKSLVDRVDTVAEVLDIPRTRLLIDALENKLDELATENGTLVKERVKCGSDCICNDGNGHGPYLYRYYRERCTLQSEYVGTV